MTSAAIVLSVVTVLLLLLFFLIAPAKARPQTTVFANRFYAHRGLYDPQNNIPENSLAAFLAAREQGYGVELDVRLSRDGEVVVFHDSDLFRMCGRTEKIGELDYDDLRTLPLAGTRESIPSLAQALSVLGGAPVICEIKTEWDEKNTDLLCRKTAALLRAYQGDCCIESFSPLAVRWFYKNAPDIVRGILAWQPRKIDAAGLLCAHLCGNFLCRPDFVAYHIHGSSPALRAVRAMGALTIAWGVHSEEELTRAEKNYDAFIFDGFSMQ